MLKSVPNVEQKVGVEERLRKSINYYQLHVWKHCQTEPIRF